MASQDPDTRIRELERQVELLRSNNARDKEHILHLEYNRINQGSTYERADGLERYLMARDSDDYDGGWDGNNSEYEYEQFDDDDEAVPEEYAMAFRDPIDQDGPDNPFSAPTMPAVVQNLQAEIDVLKERAETEHAEYEKVMSELKRLREEKAQQEQLREQQSGARSAASPSNVPQVGWYGSSNIVNFGNNIPPQPHATPGFAPNPALRPSPMSAGGHVPDPRRGGNTHGRRSHNRRGERNPAQPTRPIELPMLGSHRVYRYPSETHLRNRRRCEVEVNQGQCLDEDCKEWHEKPLPKDHNNKSKRRS